MPDDCIFLSAGDPSGDNATAKVIESLLERKQLKIFGLGGKRLKKLGQEQLAEPAPPGGITSKHSGRKLKRQGWLPGTSMAMRFQKKRRTRSSALSRTSLMRLIFWYIALQPPEGSIRRPVKYILPSSNRSVSRSPQVQWISSPASSARSPPNRPTP